MRHFALCMAAAVLCVLASPASAEFFTGNKLKQLLDGYDRFNEHRGTAADSSDAELVMGYIAGVHDALRGVFICSRGQETVGQMVAIVEQYVNAHPADWTQSADQLTMRALSEAFPCKPK